MHQLADNFPGREIPGMLYNSRGAKMYILRDTPTAKNTYGSLLAFGDHHRFYSSPIFQFE